MSGRKMAILAAAIVLGTSGCHFEVSTSRTVAVSKAKLEDAVTKWLTGQLGEVKSVACDGNLDGKVGATQHCGAVTSDGTHRDVNLTVTGVQGDDINYNLKLEPTQTT